MAATALNTTTLSEALTSESNEFNVGSTTNISAGNILVVRNEAMKVQEVPISGRVKVMRGVGGTQARAHASGQRLFIGSPDAFKAIKDSLTALTGNSGTYPDYLLPGQRAKDGSGNEYIMVDLTATTYSGTTVRISTDGLFTATVLSGGEQGPVGVTMEGGTSDQYVWAQIYGYNAFAQDSVGDSAGSSGLLALAASSNSTPDVGLAAVAATSHSSVAGAAQYVIQGMFIVGSATTATTSASSATGVAYPVFLNYPYVTGYARVTAPTS